MMERREFEETVTKAVRECREARSHWSFVSPHLRTAPSFVAHLETLLSTLRSIDPQISDRHFTHCNAMIQEDIENIPDCIEWITRYLPKLRRKQLTVEEETLLNDAQERNRTTEIIARATYFAALEWKHSLCTGEPAADNQPPLNIMNLRTRLTDAIDRWPGPMNGVSSLYQTIMKMKDLNEKLASI